MIIGLGSKARQGKDSIGEYLVNKYGFQRLGFADQLKLFCEIHHNMKKKDATLLQKVGLEFRKSDPLFWIRKVDNIISNSPKENYVITDVRFKNEFEYVKDRGGVVWDVRRYYTSMIVTGKQRI